MLYLKAAYFAIAVAIGLICLGFTGECVRLFFSKKSKTRHRLEITLTLAGHTTTIIKKTYRYEWIAVLAAWWHSLNLPNMKPFRIETKIEPIHG